MQTETLTVTIIYLFSDIDDCILGIGHKCLNGATCQDGINNYTCNCPPGLTGFYCETGNLSN